MRVLHVARPGSDDQCDRLLLTLARERSLWPGMHSRFALCPPGRLGHELEAAGAAVYDLGAMRNRDPLSQWRARSRLRSIVDENRIEAVVCHRTQTLEALSTTVRSIHRPVILWMHSHDDAAGWIRRPDQAAFADMVLCNSEFTKDDLRARSPHAAIETIHYPIVPPEMHRDARASIRRKHGAADDTVVIISGADHQRAEMMIRASRELHENAGWIIWLVSSRTQGNHEHASLKRDADAAGIGPRIRFVSDVDAPDFLAAGDIYCETNSHPQPFSWRLVEAMYSGLPLLATAVGATREIADESCAILVAPADEGWLVAALGELIANRGLRARLGAAGPLRARALFEPREQMRRLANCLARTTEFDLGSFQARTR